MADKLPWYSFLYRLLGAQGTFWLWLLTLMVCWWTANPAFVRLANRKPISLTVKQAAQAEEMTRWVTLEGVELELTADLLLRAQESKISRVRVLIDARDAAAQWWAETRRLADAIHAETAGPAEQTDFADRHKELYLARKSKLAGNAKFLPVPGEALVLLRDGDPPAISSQPQRVANEGSLTKHYESSQKAWVEQVRTGVRPEQQVQGLLDPTPLFLTGHLRDDFGFEPAPYLVQVDRELRELESILFGVSAILLLFLAAGLYGAHRVQSNHNWSASRSPQAPEVENGESST